MNLLHTSLPPRGGPEDRPVTGIKPSQALCGRRLHCASETALGTQRWGDRRTVSLPRPRAPISSNMLEVVVPPSPHFTPTSRHGHSASEHEGS